MVADRILFDLIRDYFLFYLPKVRDCSQHTLRLRLTCIKAFFSYTADVEPTAVIHADEISKVTVGKCPTQQIVDYLTEPAVKALLEQPDPLTKKGMCDRLFMLLLYDAGARLQEIRGLRLRDITWGKTVNLTLYGKGGKIRTVPIMQPTSEHLKNYLNIFHPSGTENSNRYSEATLFYVEQHQRQEPFSDSMVRKLVRSYGQAAKAICPELPDIVHPHLLRHSRAMHLYQHGMDLTLIQQWLGHSQLKTTYIYAYADTEHKRIAMEKSTTAGNPLRSKHSSERYSVTDEDTLRQLYGLT